MPRRGDRYSGIATVTGWGHNGTRVGSSSAPSLQFLHLILFNISRCRSYENLQRVQVKPDQIQFPGDEEPQFCVGYVRGESFSKGVCYVSISLFDNGSLLIH